MVTACFANGRPTIQALKGLHCSFYCSLGDWLNNISDELTDLRWDGVTDEDDHILFRYYIRILKFVSEVFEDFIVLHAFANNHVAGKTMHKSKAGESFAKGQFAENELKNLSNFINSVTKHKSKSKNLHVCNHHLKVVFEYFGAIHEENQISLDNQPWDRVDNTTTILMPCLTYLIEVVIRLHEKLGSLLEDDSYAEKVYEHYAGKYE